MNITHRIFSCIKQIVTLLVFCLSLATLPLYAASNIHYTFEDTPNSVIIGSSLSGLNFSVPNGHWRYGDARTGNYDAPYPRGAFAVEGNGFAWTAQAPGDARITFTEGTATFFAAAFSSKDSLNITAYDSQDREVTSAVLRANANTGRLDVVRLEAPAGKGIAYVVISGTQNRWIMDNLETDAPLPAPPPDVPLPASPQAEPAMVTVAQLPSPHLDASPGSVISYDIVATNRGRGLAKNVKITLPFDPSEVSVLDAHFSRPTAWVSQLLTSTLQIDTGSLGGGNDVITATVRLRVLPGVAVGTQLSERLSFHWSDGGRGGDGQSNLPVLVVGQEATSVPTYPLTIDRAVGASTLSLSSSIFIPGEPIALWYDAPDGHSVGAGTVTADANGALHATLSIAGLPSGRYQFIASGTWSQLTATGLTAIR